MEVRSKPKVSAYDCRGEGEGSEEEGEGLGPDASIVLEDELETRIPYSAVSWL